MPEYRRAREPGGMYFFTVVTFGRKPILTSAQSRAILRKVWKRVQTRHPFKTVAICLLPDHLNAIWKLPEGDVDFPMRWNEVKRHFTHEYQNQVGMGEERNTSRLKRLEQSIWQRRYWGHTFYDEEDLNTHIDYIHFNPMKHGLVKQVSEWPWSSFHRYVRMGVYPPDWGGYAEDVFNDRSMGE